MQFNKKQHQKKVLKANLCLLVEQVQNTTTGKVLLTILFIAFLMLISR